LKTALFPYAGGKSRVADLIWSNIGDVDAFIEPFAGSAAVSLLRPDWHRGRTRILNDNNGLLVNALRAVKYDPGGVVEYADVQRSEIDLAAFFRWLRGVDLVEALKGDPDYYDPKAAGRWLYAMCLPIVYREACRAQNPCAFQAPSGGIGYAWMKWADLPERCAEVAARLRNTLIRCGDWERSLDLLRAHSGTVGVLLDPPYGVGMSNMYHEEHDATISEQAREWAIEWGRKWRVVLCGYHEHDGKMPADWHCERWGGRTYGFGNSQSSRQEAIWFSPACESQQRSLF
jgi:site-specific DNA-adenine methylase